MCELESSLYMLCFVWASVVKQVWLLSYLHAVHMSQPWNSSRVRYKRKHEPRHGTENQCAVHKQRMTTFKCMNHVDRNDKQCYCNPIGASPKQKAGFLFKEPPGLGFWYWLWPTWYFISTRDQTCKSPSQRPTSLLTKMRPSINLTKRWDRSRYLARWWHMSYTL